MATADCRITRHPAIVNACLKLSLEAPWTKTQTTFFERDPQTGRAFTVFGYAITVPGFKYPVAIDESGQPHFDIFKGSWGSEAKLGELLIALNVEQDLLVANENDHQVLSDQLRDDGAREVLYDDHPERYEDIFA
jgi:hypothetical protein